MQACFPASLPPWLYTAGGGGGFSRFPPACLSAVSQTRLLQGPSPTGSPGVTVTPPLSLSAVNSEAWKQNPSPGAFCLLEPLEKEDHVGGGGSLPRDRDFERLEKQGSGRVPKMSQTGPVCAGP